ncbi:MAG TPA: MoaD/ThiS family protein [Rhodanobacteraceae bacterium]
MNAARDSVAMAPRVTVLVPAALRAHCAGARELDVHATTVRAALAAVGDRHPEFVQYVLARDGTLRPFVNVFLHAGNVRDLDGLDTRLADGDKLMIVPSVAGG